MDNKTKLSWDDITICDFIRIQNIAENKDIDELTRTIELLKVITHNENIDDLTVDDFQKETIKLKLLELPLKHNKVKSEYILNGTKLKLYKDMDKLTTGQYIDYLNYCNAGVEAENIEQILSVFLIPDGYKYNKDYNLSDINELIKNYLPITDAIGISDFFVKCQKKYVAALKDYSIKTILLTKMPLKKKIQLIKMNNNLTSLYLDNMV